MIYVNNSFIDAVHTVGTVKAHGKAIVDGALDYKK